MDLACAPLTVSEIECLRLSRDLRTTLDVADRRGCSKRTVDFHLQNVYAKLRVRSKKDAILRGEDLGLIPPREPRCR